MSWRGGTRGRQDEDADVCAAVAVAWGLASSAAAEPFEVVVEAMLDDAFDECDLDGASIRIVYAADTTDVHTSAVFPPGSARAFFDVFEMRVAITNRPNGAPDIARVTTNDPTVANYFPPSTDHDGIYFDARVFHGVLEDAMWVETVMIDLGSRDFFEGTELVTDLSFFTTLFGTELTLGWPGEVTVGSSSRYSFVGTKVTVPEPVTPAAGLVAIAAVACSRRRARGDHAVTSTQMPAPASATPLSRPPCTP